MINQADEINEENTGNDGQPDAVDWSELDALSLLQKPGNPDLRRKLITSYLTTMPAMMESAKAAVQAMDGQALKSAAHYMKSSSIVIGAMVFGKTCAELEQLGRANALEDAPALLSRAEHEFAAVCTAFRGALEMT